MKRLCRWIGPANNIGQAFCSFILIDNGEYISRSSVIPLTESELHQPETKLQMSKFDEAICEKMGNHRQAIFDPNKPEAIYTNLFEYDDDSPNEVPYGNELRDEIPHEINEPYIIALDEYIGTKVVVPGSTPGVEPVLATIKGRKRDHNGNPVGQSHQNPILDTRIYQLEFPDGRVEEYGMNVIAEHLYSQVDEHGYDTGIFLEIIDFRRDDKVAADCKNGTYTTIQGIERPVITTKGWELLVQWTDKSTTWVPLSHIKESNPIEVAEFAFANGIHNEPAFKWWAHKVLKKRDTIISKVKTRAQRKGNMKFGVTVPVSAREAIELDKENNNTLWQDAMKKEMENARVAFDFRPTGERPPPGWKRITCHMNFEVKIDLRRKARYVAGGHLTDPPTSMTYSTVVSRESVRIAFLVAALNGLDVLAGDIQNAYLNAPTKEKNYFYAGDEWGPDKGRLVLIVRALYGLKSSALQWQNHLADVLANKLGFVSSLADPDLWYKPATKPNGEKYYSYLLVYVDDILVIDINPSKYMAMLQEAYTVRKETIEEPKKYLGADISKVFFSDGSHAWTMSSSSYIKAAIKNVKARLAKDGFRFNPKLSSMEYSAKQPFSTTLYRPELDTSTECNEMQTQLYQNLIGVLRWVVELGRIDICYELALLSKYLASPRCGHIHQALHIFKYLDIHQENELTFDPNYYNIPAYQMNDADSKIQAMKNLYVDTEDDTPPNAPEPRGIPVQINCFVDSDHAGDRVTRRSHTGILIYLNNAPIIWYSKKQSTVESSTFGSEFVALRIATETIISLRYKLMMFGIPIDGYANVMCDNEAVFKNASIAESRLKKKHNSVCFHRVREAVARGILVPFKVDSKYNLADILTKSLPETTRVCLRKMIMPSHN